MEAKSKDSSTSNEEVRGKITKTFGEITFNSNFDSGNLDRVELEGTSPRGEFIEFNLWISPDCAGTVNENTNRSWFYYSVCTSVSYDGKMIKMNIKNLNKQGRLYQQGHTPLIRTIPGRGGWEKMRERPEWQSSDTGTSLTFSFSPPDQRKSTSYFAFCYPFSYNDCLKHLSKIEQRLIKREQQEEECSIYYHRDLLCYSLDGLRVELLTLSSKDGITMETEPRLPGTFPDETMPTAQRFKNKKVVFITCRVHPGETPSSYVFKGFLDFLLRPDDPRSIALLSHYVFKLIPIINPDGVYRGHYRTDSNGVNLNRVYTQPDPLLHPSVYAIRQLMLYYNGNIITPFIKESFSSSKDSFPNSKDSFPSSKDSNSKDTFPDSKDSFPDLRCSFSSPNCTSNETSLINTKHLFHSSSTPNCGSTLYKTTPPHTSNSSKMGVALYVDLHAHATKRGCFMYGNHFTDPIVQSECMTFPKLISLNSAHFDFEHCLFSERNMYAIDKRSGVSKEGSGRVALYKATGLIHCYTLECNYNSGRIVNQVTAATMDSGRATPPQDGSLIPHKLLAKDYEEVGRGLAISILDLYNINPWSRLPTSTYSSLHGVKEYLVNKISIDRKRILEPRKNKRPSWIEKQVETTPPTPPIRTDNDKDVSPPLSSRTHLVLTKATTVPINIQLMPRPFNKLRPPLSATFPEGIPNDRKATPTTTPPTHKTSPFHLPLIRNRSLTTPPSNNVTLLMIGTAPLENKNEKITTQQNKPKKITDKLTLHDTGLILAESPPIRCVFPEDFLSIVGQKQASEMSSLVIEPHPHKRGGASSKGLTSTNIHIEKSATKSRLKGRKILSRSGSTHHRSMNTTATCTATTTTKLHRTVISPLHSKRTTLPTPTSTHTTTTTACTDRCTVLSDIVAKTSLLKVNNIRSSPVTTLKATNKLLYK